MVNIYPLLILLLIDSVLRQLLSSHYSLHLFCVWDFISICDTYKHSKYIWEIGPSKGSNYRYVRIVYSSLSTPSFQFDQRLYVLYQVRFIFTIHRDTDDNPCTYDLDGYDDSEDAVNGNAREEAATGSILGVGIWVS